MRRFVSVVLMSWFVVLLSACGGGDDGGSNPAVTYPYTTELQHTVLVDTSSSLEWTTPAAEILYENSITHESVALLMNQAEAKQYCADLSLDGKTDWRLPNANEVGDALLFDQVFSEVLLADKPFTAFGLHNFHMDEKTVNDPDGVSLHEAIFTYDLVNSTKLLEYGSTWNVASLDGGVICVRGAHIHQPPVATVGIWEDPVLHGGMARPVNLQIKENAYAGEISNITNNEITYTGWVTEYGCGDFGDCPEFLKLENATLIRSGINNVKLKGEFKAFANENVSLAKAKMNNPTAAKTGVAGVGDIDVVLGGAAYYLFSPATAQNPAGTTELAADGSGKLIVYCAVGDDGRLILDDLSPVTTPTGTIEVDVTDHEGNEATFTVEIIGEESDVGVLNVPEAAIPYNFKSTIDHGRDYIYYGYNDGETALSYNKQLSICNIGTMDISGTTFTIDVAAEDVTLVRSFSHDYSGSATGFGAGACQTYTLSMAFNRPAQDDEVKINITITDNFNQTTWDDYTTFKLSQYTPLPLYFAADTNTLDPFFSNGLQGLLVAPGRQLLRVNFTSFDSNNFIRVPRKLDDEYQVILATTNINDESTYMISTDQEPDITLMAAFTEVDINEPDNSYDQATIMPLLNGEAIGYLHKGDIDFYRLTETP